MEWVIGIAVVLYIIIGAFVGGFLAALTSPNPEVAFWRQLWIGATWPYWVFQLIR